MIMMMRELSEKLIAPCGMNCRICISFFGYTMNGKKRKIQCVGCKPSGKSCAHLKKFCKKLLKNEIEYCYECNDFPCKQLQKLDKKYRERYDMSMIDNLRMIKKQAMDAFLKEQEKKYKCPECGEVICVHNGKCYSCDTLIKD